MFPTSGPVQQSYKEAVKGTVRMAAAVGSNSSTCRPVPGRQVIIPLHAVERWHLFLSDCMYCRMIYTHVHPSQEPDILYLFGVHSCLFILYLSTFSSNLVLYLMMYLFARVFNVCTHTCTRGITWKMNMHMCLSMPWHLTCYRRAISILKSQPAFISYNVLTL